MRARPWPSAHLAWPDPARGRWPPSPPSTAPSWSVWTSGCSRACSRSGIHGKRGLVFSFPRQFGSLGETVGQFLDATFAPSRFEERPLVRGVYFTSGTQTGTPIDRVLGAIAANFGLGRQGTGTLHRDRQELLRHPAAAAKSYSRRPDSPDSTRAWSAAGCWLRRGAYASAAGIALLAAAAWTTSYSRNRSYVADGGGVGRLTSRRRIEVLTPRGPRPARRAAAPGCRPRDSGRLRGPGRRCPLVHGTGTLPGRQARLPGHAGLPPTAPQGPAAPRHARLEDQIRQGASRTRSISTTRCASI